MSGALVDLVAKGVQDVYLTGKPEVSFFKQNYRRHTNFSMTNARLNPMGSGLEHTIKIVNKGDLLNYVWVDLGSTATVGSAAVAANTESPAIFELWIGGQMVDRQDAFFMVQLWQKFLVDSGAKSMALVNDDDDSTSGAQILGAKWMPLHFLFCDSYYLPLVALQYNEVEIRIRYAATTNVSDFKYYANYIVLDTAERDFFVNNEHEILIEQVQKITSEGSSSVPKFSLSLLNHPVKCLLWGQPDNTNTFTTEDVQIYLNGTELFESPMPDKFFTQVQGYYHSEYGSELLKGAAGTAGTGGRLKMYSFAMKANRHQPCGTCNFSRLDNAEMLIGSTSGTTPTNFYLYAVNYNILKIKKGMAGVAFSN
jgi:hypothetical protein